MEGLEARLVEFYSPQTDTLRMRQLEQELHEFRKRPDALQLALQFLERSSSPYVQWFCAMILEEWVGRRWVALGPAQQDQLRQFVLHYLTDTSRRLEPFVMSKMSKVLVDIGKMAWPQQYPSMFEDVRSLCMSPTTYTLGLSLLSMIGIEFVREDLVLPSKRKAELRSGLQAELPAIVQLLTSLLAHGGSSDLTVAALRCLGGYVESGAMTPVLSQSVCAEVFKVLQRTDAQGRLLLLPSSQVAAEAVRVLTEVLNKRLVPPELGDFVLSVAMSMCSILQGLVRPSEGPALVSTIDEELLAGLLEFMTVFLEQHLGRMLVNPAFPFANFLVLLADFTFGLPGPRVLQRCFLPWTALLEHLSESEAGLQALGDSSEMLSLFARALLDKMLFVTNADALAELDDEAPLGGGGGEGEESAAADQLPDWDDEDEVGALPVERSEQQEVIGEGAALLRSLARLPSCSMALSTRVLSLLHEALAALETASGADVEQRRVDACTLLSLAVVLVPQSPADAYWSMLRLVLDFTRRVTAARLYSRGAGWVDLQCSTLEALRDLSQGLDAAVAGGSSVTEEAVSGIVDVALASLDTMVVPAPEPVQQEAAALVLSLAQRLPFDLLRSCRAFQGLLANDSYQRLLAPLPLSVQERLIQAISLLLLPNTTARPVAGLDDAAMASAYAAFLTPLLRSLAEGQEQLAAGGGMNQQQRPIPPSIRRTAGALRALCSLYKTTPKRIKQVLYNALLPGLPSVLPCVSLTLAKLGHVTGSSGAARTLMNLLMALVVCFGKDLGPTFISDVMGVFTALFSSPEFVGGLSRQVSASKQQRHRRNPSDSSVSYSASTFVVASLLRLLTRILSERWSSASSFLPAICSLLLDQLLLLVRAAPTELTALFLDVTAALLTEHWRFFVAAGAVNRLGLPEGPKRFTSAEAQDIFNRFMAVILEVLRSVSLPPATVRKAIDVLLLLSKSVSLFTLQHFRDTVGPAFTLALIDVLLSRAHPLLRDDIAMLLYEMTVGADPDAAIAQPILVHITGLSDAQRGELMQSFPQDRDGPNFVRGLKGFLNDVEFLRLCNEAAAAS